MYVIGGRLLVHCTEGNYSLEVQLSEVHQYFHLKIWVLQDNGTVFHPLCIVPISWHRLLKHFLVNYP